MGSRNRTNRIVLVLLGVAFIATVAIVVALEMNRKPTQREEYARLKESVTKRDPIVADLRKDVLNAADDISLAADPTKNKEAVDKLVDRMQGRLEEFGAASLSDREKQCVKLISDFAGVTKVAAGEWQDAVNTLQKEPLLEFSKKVDAADLNRRIATVENYIAATKKYGAFAKDGVRKIRTDITALNDKYDSLGGYLEGVDTAEGMHNRSLHPVLAVHTQRGETMLKALRLLRDEYGSWSVGFFGVAFKDDETSDQYDKLIEQVGKAEMEINRLAQQVVEEMKKFGT
jgi:hypothetical protein